MADVADRLAALEGAVRALTEEVRALRLERAPVRDPLSRADRARLARVLPAIAGTLGSAPFTARELVDVEAAAAVRIVTRGLNARQLGRLFRRGEAHAVDGYVVERDGVELGVVLWRVLAAPGNGKVSVPPRPAPRAV